MIWIILYNNIIKDNLSRPRVRSHLKLEMSKTTRKERIIPIKIEGAEEETVKPAPQSKEAKNVSKLPSISPNKSEEKMKSSAMDVESDQDSDGTTGKISDYIITDLNVGFRWVCGGIDTAYS